MLDPAIYREAADFFLAANRDQLERKQKGMCTALAQAHGWRARADDLPANFQSQLDHVFALKQYFRPDRAVTYWWPDLTPQSQAERFMALHFMALIAEDLE